MIFRPLPQNFRKSGRDGKKLLSYSYSAGEKANWILKIFSWDFFLRASVIEQSCCWMDLFYLLYDLLEAFANGIKYALIGASSRPQTPISNASFEVWVRTDWCFITPTDTNQQCRYWSLSTHWLVLHHAHRHQSAMPVLKFEYALIGASSRPQTPISNAGIEVWVRTGWCFITPTDTNQQCQFWSLSTHWLVLHHAHRH